MHTIVEEFWVPCNYPLTLQLIKSILKSGRLKGEFIYLVSQSPEDAIDCAEFPAIVQQTPTKIMLPNPDAEEVAYTKVGLTHKEFKKLKMLDKESRTFLIKQSNSSCFAKMDLQNFEEFLSIISGTKENITLCEEIRYTINSDDPEQWVPVFLECLKRRRQV
jgi:type IV secretion system protein VirB4